MTKLALICFISCLGVVGYNALHRGAQETRTAAAVMRQESQAASTGLAEAQEEVAAVRTEILEKRNHLQEAGRHREISPELLQLLERGVGGPTVWAELRQRLGIGWDNSPDYVLVSKRVLKQLDYPRLLSSARASDTACDLLALSPAEQAAIQTVLDRVREGQWLRVERVEPARDVVAQYTVPAPDPAFEQSQKNLFVTELTRVLGPERAELLFDAWRELKSDLAPARAETMTIRRTVVDGEPDLICEMRRADQLATLPVRYAHYPSGWFLKFFPGGWETLADHEGFELPAKFRK
jgi:hypothetical protein